VTAILVDHNIEGHAALLWSTLHTEGWLDLVSLQFVLFTDVDLARTSSDREVWQFAQAQQMLLLTTNRNMQGEDSLERTIRVANEAMSLPVLTIGDVDRMFDTLYRRRCATRLTEIVLYLDNYRGTGRLFIP
jgi:hypothetical protein